jgi:hypothetical protein
MTSADPINVYRIALDDDGSPAMNATVRSVDSFVIVT